jgi:glycine/D-amino acid oxidase-like deaminating enzyme
MTGPPTDEIVVGAGIVGAACAAALARDGMRVTVLEADIPAGGTTAAGMGHLVVMDDSPEQLALTGYSLRLWKKIAPNLPLNVELEQTGTIWVAEDEEQLSCLREKHATYAAAGIQSELLDERALGDAEPQLRRGLVGGLRVAGDCVVYPPTAALALLDRARGNGAVVRRQRVDAIQAHAAVCSHETLRAEFIVNATGSRAADLTPGISIVPRKGHLAITDRYPGFCHHQIVETGYLTSAHVMTSESVAFNVQPRRTGQVLVGSSRELVGWDARPNPEILSRMLERAIAFMPGLAGLSVIRTWTGFRPTTPDKLPLIGFLDDRPGVIVAAGHEGLGITTATATAEIVAALVAGRAPEIEPAPYSPMRTTARMAMTA